MTNEEAISRQAVMNIISFEYGWLIDVKEYNTNIRIAFNSLMSKVKALPSVTPKAESKDKPKGRWIDIGNEGLVFRCSLCGNKNTIESNYCPNCGAKMEVEDEADN